MFSHSYQKMIRNAINADDRLEMTSPSRPIRARRTFEDAPKKLSPDYVEPLQD